MEIWQTDWCDNPLRFYGSYAVDSAEVKLAREIFDSQMALYGMATVRITECEMFDAEETP